MSHLIRNPKEFWSGAIFIVFGVTAVVIGQDYSMGSSGRMGPAYFPTVLGTLLAVIGAVSMLRSIYRGGEAVDKFALKNIVLILAAVLLFGALVRGAGLAAAVVALILLSGVTSVRFRWKPYFALAAGLAIFSVLVFVAGLGLPMPAIGPWFGY